MRTVLSAIAFAVFASGAFAQSTADNSFGLNKVLDASSTLDIGLVRSASNGQVMIYDMGGHLLGLEAVKAGANPHVRINLGAAPMGDVTAVLEVNGEAVASQDIEIVRDGSPR